MSEFYIKNRKGEFLPVELSHYLSKDLKDRLIVVRVGTDNHPASMSDLDETEDSFNQAEVLSDLENVSVIITPYQIDVDVVNNEEIEGKKVCLQISSGDDIGMLESSIQKIYKKWGKRFDLEILPTPLTVKEYRHIRDILKRCDIRRKRRSRTR